MESRNRQPGGSPASSMRWPFMKGCIRRSSRASRWSEVRSRCPAPRWSISRTSSSSARAGRRAYLGGKVYQYDAFNYLVSSVPIPAECETDASPEEPVLFVAINVEPTMLGEMLLEMDEPLPAGRPDAAGHLHDPDERGAERGRHPAPRVPQVPARQPHARPPDGP